MTGPADADHRARPVTPEALPGLDLGGLAAWLDTSLPGFVVHGPLSARLVTGGRSNLTYVVADGTTQWIVRRPPLGHVLATAHDMEREHRVMSALRDTAVPVPRMYGLCTDVDVIGAPFSVMELVTGLPYRCRAELELLGATRARSISERLIDTMAALHTVNPDEVGLARFGRPEGYLSRQMARWKKQLDASYSRPLPAADELYRRLVQDVPPESAVGIVHGDFRLDNLLVDDGDRVTAVLDWEMATLGDPLTDLALMVTYHRLAALLPGAVTDANMATGFLTESQLIARYEGGSTRDLSRFGFYLGLAAYKLAGILEGIHFRYLQGQTVGDGYEGIGEAIGPLLELGLDAAKEKC